MASIKEIEQKVNTHGDKIILFENFLRNDLPEIKTDVKETRESVIVIEQKLTNGSYRKMSNPQFWSLLITLILGFLTLILKT